MPSAENPTAELLTAIRDKMLAEFNAEILAKSNFTETKHRVDLLVAELAYIGGAGGSDRAYVEHKLVELFQKFEDPGASDGYAWPVEKFLRGYVNANR